MKCIIALTSYAPRLATLYKAIHNLVDDPDFRVVLTLYKKDLELLPDEIKLLILYGKLQLIVTDFDYKQHKKYIEVFKLYLDKYPVILIDDDVDYTLSQMRDLYNSYLKNNKCIHARTAHVIVFRDGRLRSYIKWPYIHSIETEPSMIFEPIGNGGVLYPPGFKPIFDFNDWTIGDDITLKAAAIRQGIPTKMVKSTKSIQLHDKTILDSRSCKWQRKRTNSYIKMYAKEFNSVNETIHTNNKK